MTRPGRHDEQDPEEQEAREQLRSKPEAEPKRMAQVEEEHDAPTPGIVIRS